MALRNSRLWQDSLAHATVFEGDANECAKWHGWAIQKLGFMLHSTPGATTQIFNPSDSVAIRISTRPNRIEINAGGVAQVCWFLPSQGSTFITKDKQSNKASYRSSAGSGFHANYWVEPTYKDAASFYIGGMFYRGKFFGLGESFLPYIVSTLTGAFAGNTLLLVFRDSYTGKRWLCQGSYSNSGLEIKSDLTDLGSVLALTEDIIFAAIGGVDVLWLVSRKNTKPYSVTVRAYLFGYSAGFVFTPLGSKTYDEYYKRESVLTFQDTPANSTEVTPAYTTGSYPNGTYEGHTAVFNRVGAYYDSRVVHIDSYKGDIQDIFVFGDKLSISFREFTNRSEKWDVRTQPTITIPSYVSGSQSVGSGAYSRTEMMAKSFSVTTTKDFGVKSDITGKIYTEVFQVQRGDTPTISNTKVYELSIPEEHYSRVGTEITTSEAKTISTTFYYTGVPPTGTLINTDGPNATIDTPESRVIDFPVKATEYVRDFYCYHGNGIDGVHSLYYDIAKTYTDKDSERIEYGDLRIGLNDALIDTSTKKTTVLPGLEHSAAIMSTERGNSSTVIESAANGSTFLQSQGITGAYDGKTYIVRRYNDSLAGRSNMSFTLNPPALYLSLPGEKRALTLGVK